MSATNGHEPLEVDIDQDVFQNFADLEKEFAKVELDALRRKEYNLRNLYQKRSVVASQIPNFWPSVLMSGPQEFQSVLGEEDAEPLAAVKSMSVERYEIKSETEGEPRSLRFTFEFNENDWFEDTKVVKEFKFVGRGDDEPGSLVSKPVTFKWKKKGKKSNSGLLDLAMDLYKAEEAVRLKDGKTGDDLNIVERETLWQYEKLKMKLDKLEKLDEDDEAPVSWLDWFGYRGAVRKKTKKEEDANSEDEEEDPEDDGILNVEIFPPGEEIAIALAEDLWPNVMDYFMASQQDPMLDEDDFNGLDSDDAEEFEDDEVPELVAVEEERPSKRQKKA